MAKKVFKGYCDNKLKIKDIVSWYGWDDPDALQVEPFIMREKGVAADWHPDAWPPRCVTVTIEVED